MSMTQPKSPGQLAYERELAVVPYYPGTGECRPQWGQLPDYVRESWERNPTDRAWLWPKGGEA